MKRGLKLAASLAVTLAFTAWAFRDTHWSEQWASLKAAHYWWLLPYLLVLTLIHLFTPFAGGACSPAWPASRFVHSTTRAPLAS